MQLGQKIIQFSLKHYKGVTVFMLLITLVFAAFIIRIRVDTDPENMLSASEPIRVFHDQTKKAFDLSDMVVLGIVNPDDPDGVFNPESLRKIYELTEFAKELTWPAADDPRVQAGVVTADIIAPSEVDHIEQAGPGVVKFAWLMHKPPATRQEALSIRDRVLSNPLLKGTLVSEDGLAICLYLPLTSKDQSYRVYKELNKKIAQLGGPEKYHITGLPVAEDTFGVEMFVQMGISAPLAMITIFVLMLIFFRKLVLIVSPIVIALVTVISTMGLLIGFGYPVHIMSSMIPIFLMPIAVVDSVHILSEFYDLYTPAKGKKQVISEVMHNLFIPMLYTSLTSAAGFLSLSLTPIPPVQVFGVFVAVGIAIAWIWTIIFVPAYVMWIPDKSLANFGAALHHAEKPGRLGQFLQWLGSFTLSYARVIVVFMVLITLAAVYGITRIRINDNPVKWFSRSHPIRVADIVLNQHFGGTYMAYLVLDDAGQGKITDNFLDALRYRLKQRERELSSAGDPNASTGDQTASAFNLAGKALAEKAPTAADKETLLNDMSEYANEKMNNSTGNTADAWYEIADFFDLEREGLKIFKQPEVLRYLERLQDYMLTVHNDGRALVGKTSSVADVVKKVYQELVDGRRENYRVPDTLPAVAQSLLQYQSSHKPDDLWHLVTSDYLRANIWCQLTSGDNLDMNKVVADVKKFIQDNPPPVPLAYHWAGLTYINTVWQDKMVSGMLQSFLGSFLVVFIMMTILFRSVWWGLICMIPLTITIALIYGIIGFVGKDYDMPVAVLSSLTLGMAVDFAIHFLERSREAYRKNGSWSAGVPEIFGEPARAITRNVLVIAVGFLPLLAAPLAPYKTVGIFLCAIMGLSGAITLLALPAVLRLGERYFFRPTIQPAGASCNCGLCIIVSVAMVLVVALNIHQYAMVGWSRLAWFSVVLIPLAALTCGILSRRRACRTNEKS